MKILIVGSNRIYSIENFYVKYLKQEGVSVNHFLSQNYFYDYYEKSIINKILHRIGLSRILNEINDAFKKEVDLFNPDIIWVFKGMELFPASLIWAKKKGIKLVNFNGDSPFLFSGKGSGNANVTNSIDLYDMHFTYNKAVESKLKHCAKGKVVILPFGFEIEERILEISRNQKEKLGVCFLGNPDTERGKFLQNIAQAGIAIDLYGNKWGKFVTHKNAKCFGPVYADEAWNVLRKYRVQLNLMRPHNPDAHNMRTFELGGIGAIQLAQDTPDHQHYFLPEKEIFLFNDIDSCIAKIKFLLSLTKEEADQIRANIRNRSIESGYCYKDRSHQALRYLKELIA